MHNGYEVSSHAVEAPAGIEVLAPLDI